MLTIHFAKWKKNTNENDSVWTKIFWKKYKQFSCQCVECGYCLNYYIFVLKNVLMEIVSYKYKYKYNSNRKPQHQQTRSVCWTTLLVRFLPWVIAVWQNNDQNVETIVRRKNRNHCNYIQDNNTSFILLISLIFFSLLRTPSSLWTTIEL